MSSEEAGPPSPGIKSKVTPVEIVDHHEETPVEYRLYKRRFLGCLALCLLNAVGGMNWLWFSAISVDTANEFGFTLTQVNWLSNSINLIYLPVCFFIPTMVNLLGVRTNCIMAAVFLILASWLRYAGTAKSLSPSGSYALLLIGQFLAGWSQPWYQVLAPKYSETWFGLKGRTTATMLISLANPVGGAIAQLLSPSCGSPRNSVLVLGIITTAICPAALLISERPPTPPTYSGSQTAPPVLDTLRKVVGLTRPDEAPSGMDTRDRLDFAFLTWGFGVLVGIISTFSILVAQIYAPYGYNSDQSGYVGAALFIAGIVGAVSTAPLFDRYFTHHLAITVRIGVPIIGVAWVGLIFAVGHGLAPSYVVLVFAGFASFMLLPVALELACEVTRSAEFSSAALWFSANAFTVFFVLVSNDLRAGPDANPPGNLRKSLILMATFAISLTPFVTLLRGTQKRRNLDEQEDHPHAAGPSTA